MAVSSSLIPPEIGVADPGCGLEPDAARTVETSDVTNDVGVADPVVADEDRPLASWNEFSMGVVSPELEARGPRGVSDRSVSWGVSSSMWR